MELSHDPQSYISTYVSMMRNMYLLSSIGIALFGVSNNLKKNKKFLQIISQVIIFYSMTYGLNSIYDFKIYINSIKTTENMKNYDYLFRETQRRMSISLFYIIILVCISSVIIFNILKN